METVGAKCASPPERVLDLGTGCGAIALALARMFPGARVTAADSSAEALSLAAENAKTTGLAERVTLVESRWFRAIARRRDLRRRRFQPAISLEREAAAADPEVRDHEPTASLVSGADGFEDIGKIIASTPGALARGGCSPSRPAFRTTPWRPPGRSALGFTRTESLRDLTGRDRFFLAWL